MIDLLQDIWEARHRYFAQHQEYPDYVEVSHEDWDRLRHEARPEDLHWWYPETILGLPVVVRDVVGGPYLVKRNPVKITEREKR